jgi:hypothetical protein
MEHLAEVLRKTGRTTDAETMERRAEAIRAKFDRKNPTK